jgi:hypothetical protein
MKLVKRFAAALVVAALCAAPAFAQAQHGGIGLGLAGGYYSLGGDLGEGVDAGFGGAVSLRFHLKPQIVLPVIFDYSSHGLEDLDESLTNMALSIEPRYLFHMEGAKFQPFIGARLGYAQASADIAGFGEVKQSGFLYGGSAGVLIPLGTSLMFEGSVLFTAASYGDAEVDGQTIDDSDASGSILGLNLGIVYHFGKGK